ncbi:MAG: Sec-independent protein translocase protein TatCy [Planctomycetota bacterium]|jgi:sec-independent protein translocase protein TatC
MAKLSLPNNDYFEGTKMSFGEHLEELRRALFRAVLGLSIGVMLGFLVAEYVVDWIKRPLTNAMVGHTVDRNINTLKKQFQDEFSPDVEQFIREHKVKFESVYFEAHEWRRITEAVGSEAMAGPVNIRLDKPTLTDTPASTPPQQPERTTATTNADSPAPPAPATETPVAESKSGETNSGETKSGEAKTLEGGAAEGQAGENPDTKSPDTKSPNKESPDTESPGDSADAPATPKSSLVVIGENLPPPQPYLVKARVWRPIEIQVTTLNAQEAFMIWMKAAIVAGIVLSSPWIFVQIWNFVAAGLYPHEKNYVYIYLPISLGLFLGGAALAFFFVFDPVLRFLFTFNDSMNIGLDARISEWLSFVLLLPIGFGLSFQLPLVMLFLNRIGLVSLQMYIEKWRIAVLAIFVISAVLTPMDPVSLLLMALPLTLLYFFGLGLCKWMPRHKSPFSEGYDPQ